MLNVGRKLTNVVSTHFYVFRPKSMWSALHIWSTTPILILVGAYIIIQETSCRKEIVQVQLLRGSVLAKCNWETIFCGHYRSIFNHCDVIGLQSYWIRWNKAKCGLLHRSRSFL